VATRHVYVSPGQRRTRVLDPALSEIAVQGISTNSNIGKPRDAPQIRELGAKTSSATEIGEGQVVGGHSELCSLHSWV
jgi:hypothetical protein